MNDILGKQTDLSKKIILNVLKILQGVGDISAKRSRGKSLQRGYCVKVYHN